MIEKRKYAAADLPQIAAEPEAIISGAMDDEIRERMERTIEIEGPILEPLLFKRVINSMSLKKVGSRIEPVFRRIAMSLSCQKTDEDGVTVFHNGNDENFFRTAEESDRYSYQIPLSEAVHCLQYIISGSERSLTKKELAIRFRDELGYERMGAQVDNLFTRASTSPDIKRYGNGRFIPTEY